jgi:hypothetical protein
MIYAIQHLFLVLLFASMMSFAALLVIWLELRSLRRELRRESSEAKSPEARLLSRVRDVVRRSGAVRETR